jgi:hypothetical protein
MKPVFCSQCGTQQGFGFHGYSHCRDHQQRDEAARVAADVAYNRAKNNGSLLAAEIERARREELKWGEA